MNINAKEHIAIALPTEIVRALEIDEETVFCTFFEDGMLFIKLVPKEEYEKDALEKRLEQEYEDGYQEGLVEGALEGYEDGYKKGYLDSSCNKPYRNIYRGRLCELYADATESGGG